MGHKGLVLFCPFLLGLWGVCLFESLFVGGFACLGFCLLVVLFVFCLFGVCGFVWFLFGCCCYCCWFGLGVLFVCWIFPSVTV